MTIDYYSINKYRENPADCESRGKNRIPVYRHFERLHSKVTYVQGPNSPPSHFFFKKFRIWIALKSVNYSHIESWAILLMTIQF